MSIYVAGADLAGVMVDDGLGPTIEKYGKSYGANMRILREIKDEVWVQKFSVGKMSEEVFWEGCFSRAGVELDPNHIADISTYLREAHTPKREMFNYFKQLRSEGIVTALFTNTAEEWLEYWKKELSLDDYFSYIFASCYMKTRKDHADFFRIGAALMDTTPSRLIYTDDQQGNVDVARSAGAYAFLFESPEQAIVKFDENLERIRA